MERTVKMGVIGCGPRGAGLIKTICACENAEIVAVCDLYQDRVDNAIAVVQRKRGNTPVGYIDSDRLLADESVEAVLISAGWEAHRSLAVSAMEAGKIVALEVSGMFSIEDTALPYFIYFDYNEVLETIDFLELISQRLASKVNSNHFACSIAKQ